MEETFYRLLFRAFHGQNNKLQETFDELGIGRGQPKLLTYLEQFGDSSQIDIANYFNIDPASVSRMVDTLYKNGLVCRIEDKECRRANKLSLTPKGREVVYVWHEKSAEVERIMLEGFSSCDVELFKGYLKRVISNFNKDSADERT